MKRNKPDRRVQRTRQSLREALMVLMQEKTYEAITVQAILDQANVGRSTFYLHYEGGKEDLLLDLFADFQATLEIAVDELFQNNGGNLSLALFQYAEGHYPFYKATEGKASGMLLKNYIQDYLTAYLGNHLSPLLRNDVQSVFPLDAVVQHAVGSFMALLSWWFNSDRSVSAEELSEIYTRLITPGIIPLLRPSAPTNII